MFKFLFNPLCYCICVVFLVNYVPEIECIKERRSVSNRDTLNVTSRRAVVQLDDIYRKIRFNPVFGRRFLLSSIGGTAVKPIHNDANLLQSLSQSFRNLKNYLLDVVNIIAANRKQALSSTHPLRHKTWKVTIYKRGGIFGLFLTTEELIVDFMEDGSLQTSKGHKGNLQLKGCMGIAGHWWSEYGDVVWKIYLDGGEEYATYFNAQFCWNYFGASAFMRRGVTFRDRSPNSWLPKYLFRPVVGKFTGHGIE